MKGFAGTFSGTLPCADCPGIDATLELNPDGSYKITDAYQRPAVGNHTIDGSWTSEANDPGSPGSQQQRRGRTGSSRSPRMFNSRPPGSDGKPLPGLDSSLKR